MQEVILMDTGKQLQMKESGKMTPVYIDAIDIQDAWFQAISKLVDVGSKYVVERGSYEGQTRLEFDHATILIRKPYAEPYDSMLPKIPAHLNIPDPVAPGYLEHYLPYLMTAQRSPAEGYTYGQRLACAHLYTNTAGNSETFNQIEYWIKAFKQARATNQAILQIAKASDSWLSDPPCLRHIDMRVKDGVLIFYPYFRSWDLWGGFPANLAGIAVLQKYMADEIGVESGPILAASKGLHLYGYVEELARLRVNK